MDSDTAIVEVAQVALIVPAGVFLVAVVARHWTLLQGTAANEAQAVVAWYVVRRWTLWVLLGAAPFAATCLGCARLILEREPRARVSVWGATVLAGSILAIVVLHLLAN